METISLTVFQICQDSIQTAFKQYFNCFNSVQKRFCYCLNTVLLLLVNFVIFGLLFCILFKYCFVTVGVGSKITVFLPA